MHRSAFFYLIAIVMLSFLSCNLFAPTDRDAAAQRAGWQAMVLEGKIEMQNAHWDNAVTLFNKAIAASDSSSSEAFYYRGKCVLRNAGVDLQDVWGEINKDSVSKNDVPFLYHGGAPWDGLTEWRKSDTMVTRIDSVFLERKRVYDAVCKAIKDIEFITYNPQRIDATIVRKEYESDYLVEISVKSALGVVDLNNNFQLDFTGSDFPSEEQKIFRIICKDIPSLDSMSFDSLKQISKDPKDINAKLDVLVATLGKADTSYGNFSADLRQGMQQTGKLDTSMAQGVGQMVRQFGAILPYFYYDDCRDNDSNYFNTDSVWIPGTSTLAAAGPRDTCVDRMIWIDWDYDGLIDVNPPGVLPHVHIGEGAHRLAHPEWYQDVDSAAGHTYHRCRYKGPYTFEFIFGDWGVDEEIMDGKDNTFDSLVDEDTRIVSDSLDDDGDRWPPAGMPVIMQWTDGDNDFHISGLPAITAPLDTTVWTKRAKTNKYFLLGLRSVPVDTTIIVYKGAPQGEFASGNYGIDEEWFDGIDNDGDGLIDEDVGPGTPPVENRAQLIAALSDPAYHKRLHDYWNAIRAVR